jgi:Ca2+-binding EF-hand superfamily protein
LTFSFPFFLLFFLPASLLLGGNREFWKEVAMNFVDTEGDDKITFTDFIAGLSAITQGSMEDKLDWMFRLYDSDNNGVLDEKEVFSLMKGVLKSQNNQSKSWSMLEIGQAADRLFKTMDADGNGSVDKTEFVAIAKKDEHLMNALMTNIQNVTKIEGNQEFTTFDNQVAGHASGGMAMLKDPTGKTIMKVKKG